MKTNKNSFVKHFLADVYMGNEYFYSMKTALFIVLTFIAFIENSFAQDVRERIFYNYDSLISVGEKYIYDNKIDSAKRVFQHAAAINGDRAEAFYGLGYIATVKCHDDGLECNQAIDLLKKSKELDSTYRRVDYNLAVCYLKRKYYDEALQYINLAIAKNDTDPDYFATRRDILLSLGNKKAARKDNRKYKKLLHSDQ